MIYSGRTGNNSLIKNVNLQIVLSTILAQKPISRAKIASITGLNKVTVSTCVDYFLEKEIIYELGKTETTRGRPPTLIDINHQAGICIGVEVEYSELKVLISDLGGTILEKRTSQLVEKQPSYFIEYMTELLSEMQSKYTTYKLGVIGVGIALPGYYNVQTGVIEYIASLQSWNQFPIQQEMDKINPAIPFFINSSVNAGAINETYSPHREIPSVLVYVGGLWGLGIGVCIHGKSFSGKSGFAGRLGHSTIKIDGKLCSCGNKGCWEVYASAQALMEHLPEEYREANFHDIVDMLNNNDTRVVQAVEKLGYYQGIGLANVINAYNPDVICIGGYLGLLGDPLITSIEHTLSKVLPQRFLKGMSIYCSEYGELSGSYGAISMVTDNLANIFIEQAAE